jgi:Sulfotransferase family
VSLGLGMEAPNPTGSPPPPASASGPLDLLCIVGSHRSGATVVGALLASPPHHLFVGELYRLPQPIWEPGDPARGCSCGLPVLNCPFWSEVRRAAQADPTLLPSLRAGQKRFEPWARLPDTLLDKWGGSAALAKHAERKRQFLYLIARTADSPRVIESAYSPLRAWLYPLGAPPGVRVRYLHLVRDGRDFLQSEGTMGYDPEAPWPWLRSTPVVIGRWVTYNALARLFCGLHPDRYLRVRYEDILDNPRESFARIGAFLGWDLSEVADRAERGLPFVMKHIAAGNRVRLLGSVVLRGRTAPAPVLSRRARFLYWALAGWLAWSLGYGSAATSALPTLTPASGSVPPPIPPEPRV